MGEPRERLRRIYEDSISRPQQSTEELPEHISICAYLRQRLAELGSDDDVVRRLNELRGQADDLEVTNSPGQWLTDTEVVLGIASVTLAVTAIQSEVGGFSAVKPSNIRAMTPCITEPRCHPFDYAGSSSSR
jgi:hypothetical protein